MKILIKAAKVLAPDSPFHRETVDILISDGKLAKIAPSINTPADRKIAMDNLHVSPGWFDSSVSFGEPGYEERETLKNGLDAAAKSGFSSIGLNPDTYPVTDNHGAVDYLKSKSANAATSLFPLGALTQKSKGKDLAEIYDMAKAGAIAFGDYKKPIDNPNLLKIALQYAQGFGGLVQAFPYNTALSENGVVNEGKTSTQLGLKGLPALAEELQISRDLAILEYTGGKLHIPTISTAGSVHLIEKAKKKGLDVTCSTAIHNLFFTDETLTEFDTAFKVNPPLRGENDRKALVTAVKNGTIDMVTSDHRPLNIEHKKTEFDQAAFGSIGLESAFGALNKLLGTEKSIDLLTSGHERFHLEKPVLKEGQTADLSFFDPSESYTFEDNCIYSTSKNSMFLNSKLKGKAFGVFANNRLTFV